MSDPLAKLAESTGAGPDLSSTLALVRKRLWLNLGVTIIVPAVTWFIVSSQPKTYQAAVSLVIELTVPQYLGSGFRDVVEIEPSWWAARENLETEFRALRSESQALAVARKLCD